MTDPSPPGRPAPRPRWRWPALLAALTVGLVVAVVGYGPGDSPVNRSSGGRMAPAFAVPDLRDESRTIELEQLRGHPVVLNFWASWCVPCRKELPAFQAVYSRMGDQLTFLGMNHQDSRDDAVALLRKTGVQYQSGFDPRGRIAQAYALYGMPTTVFISAGGRILATRTGEMSESQLADQIRDLFAVVVPDG
ncbi:MAG TPA: TlpA disulfide reductase family protein [Acidimicrobiales bacterium]|nr:TlpA disulfide reductase family protein [Acidimicrobiales bacterium]